MLLIQANEINMDEALDATVETLNNGGIVAYPTETFYGLGVRFDRQDSLKRLCDIKQRPQEKAMPMIIGEQGMLCDLAASVNKQALLLIERFWPGPLTLIFPAKKNLSPFITAGTCKVAVRIPGKSFALQLAKAASFPITATSANPSGMPPAQDAGTVIKYFDKRIDLVVDGGSTPGGLPSTIVDVCGDEIKILREGMIQKELLISVAHKNQ